MTWTSGCFFWQLLMSVFENAMKRHNVLENDLYDWEKCNTEDLLAINAAAATAQQLTRLTPAYLGYLQPKPRLKYIFVYYAIALIFILFDLPFSPQHGQRFGAAGWAAEGEHWGRPARGAPQRCWNLPPFAHTSPRCCWKTGMGRRGQRVQPKTNRTNNQEGQGKRQFAFGCLLIIFLHLLYLQFGEDLIAAVFWPSVSGGEHGWADSQTRQPQPKKRLSAELSEAGAIRNLVPGAGCPTAPENEAQPEHGHRQEADTRTQAHPGTIPRDLVSAHHTSDGDVVADSHSQ